MNIHGRPLGAIGRWLLRPVGWPMHLLSVCALLYPTWEMRRPDGWHGSVAGIVLWFLVAVLLVSRQAIRIVVTSEYHRPSFELWQRRGHWLVAPLLWLMWMFMPSDLPMHAAFSLSRPALEKFAIQVMANPAAMTGKYQLGLYAVSVDAIRDGGILLYTGPGYDGTRCGLAYFPTTPPDNTDGRGIEYYALEGKWYTFWCRDGSMPTTLPSTFPASQATQGN